MQQILIEKEQIRLTNLSKIYWPCEGITKADFIKYYIEIAPFILPHLKDRPIVFTRYPDGIYGKSFYQKNLPEHAPCWLKTWDIYSDEGVLTRYALINDIKSLIWAANQGSIEFHQWLSKVKTIDYPDFAVFDLDPMEKTDFEDARKIAIAIKHLLDIEGLVGYPKTSGATGIQIYVPIVAKYTYKEVREFVRFFCEVIEKTFPDIATTERNISKRKGKLYLDYLQNVKGKTIIAPYSTRPKKGATVSCPITWEELKKGLKPQKFTLKNIQERVKEKGDLFKGVLENRQSIDKWVKR